MFKMARLHRFDLRWSGLREADHHIVLPTLGNYVRNSDGQEANSRAGMKEYPHAVVGRYRLDMNLGPEPLLSCSFRELTMLGLTAACIGTQVPKLTLGLLLNEHQWP